MAHGDLVTLADLDGMTTPGHWRGMWRVGPGMDALDPTTIVGNWTLFVVNSTANSGTRTLRDALSTGNRLIKFDPALGAATISISTDISLPTNFAILATRVRIDITGNGQLLRGSTAVGRQSFINLRMYHSGNNREQIGMWGMTGSGRNFMFVGWNEFHNINVDDNLDLGNGPTLGHYVTEVGNWMGPETTGMQGFSHLIGDGGRPNEYQSRIMLIRNAWYAGAAGTAHYPRQRQPFITDGHLWSYECFRRWGLSGIQTRNSASGGRRVRVLSAWDVFDGSRTESPTNGLPHGIRHQDGPNPYIRVENATRLMNNDPGTFALLEVDRDQVTPSTMFVDGSGNSIAQYDNYAPGTELAPLSGTQRRQFIMDFSRWFDWVTMTGTAQGATGGDLEGKTIVLTNSVDNWPSLSDSQKNTLIAMSQGGPGWTALKTLISPGDIGISAKVLTIALPDGADDVEFANTEQIRFRIPANLTTRSAYCEPDVLLTINAGGEPGPGPDPDIQEVTISSGWSAFVQNQVSGPTYTQFDETDRIWSGVSGPPIDGQFVHRAMWEFDFSSIPDTALVTFVQIILTVESILGDPTGRPYELRLYSSLPSGIAEPSDVYADAKSGSLIFNNLSQFTSTGQHTIQQMSGPLVNAVQSAVSGNALGDGGHQLGFGFVRQNEAVTDGVLRILSHLDSQFPPRVLVQYIEDEGPGPGPPPELGVQVVVQKVIA